MIEFMRNDLYIRMENTFYQGAELDNWSTYLLKCSDASLYCGVTNDLKKRIATHNQGTASKYTRSRIPVKLAVARNKLSKSEAYRLEYIVKKTRTDKKIKTLLNWNFSNDSY